MDINAPGIIGSLAASPLAQTRGPVADRLQLESTVQQQEIEADEQAAQAAGVGQTDGENHTIQDRHGDSRQPWEFSPPNNAADNDTESATDPAPSHEPGSPLGGLVDLTG